MWHHGAVPHASANGVQLAYETWGTLNAERDAVKPAVMVQMKGGVPVYAATVEPTR